MVTLHDSLLSSSARPLAIRRRPDLVARRHHYLGQSYWIVKDPVGLNYFRFQDEEYALLRWLDGNVSLDELKDRFEEEYPPQKITLEELQQFLGMLHRSGLVIAGVGGQGKQLFKRRRERRWKDFLGALSNVLCIRFKGFDPERILNWLYPFVKWFYSPVAFTACILLGLSALLLVGVQFPVFQSRLPEFHEFFSFENALLLSLTLGITKVLHEFGHGMACKHFGGECHEMGVMVLVLTPCLYCNVSDSWLLPNKWARAAIGAGGMYVELVLASIATWIWWYSEPHMLLNNLCLNTMFVCSVSTLIFNANPLLRYDGYYILADITEIPNLRQKATAVLGRKMGEWFLGLEQPDDPFLPERNQIFFALYSVAASIYQWVVVYSILFFLYHVFKPYGLEKIGQLIALASLWGLIVMPLYQLGKFFYVPGRLEKVKKHRMFISLAVVIAILAAVLFVPLPYTVIATMELQPHGAAPVYVDAPEGGQLLVVPGKNLAAAVKPYLDLPEGVQIIQEIAQWDTQAIARAEEERNKLAQAYKVSAETLTVLTKEIAEKKKKLAETIGPYLDKPERAPLIVDEIIAANKKDEKDLPKTGQPVAKNDVLAVLQNQDLDVKIEDFRAKVNEYRVQLDNLRGHPDPRSPESVAELEKSLKSATESFEKMNKARSDWLILRAPCDGTVLPPPPTAPMHQEKIEGGPAPRPSWSGTPLDPEHYRPFLKDGQLLCQVGDARDLEAILVIDQGEVDYVKENQVVDLKFDALPHDVLHGKIEGPISASNLKITPKRISSISSKGDVASKKNERTGVESPQSVSYQARVPITDQEGVLRIGLCGRAKIHCAPLSLGARLWRFIMNTFNFRL